MNLVELGYLAGWRVLRALPEPVAAGAFRLGADVTVRRDGRAVRRLRSNLRRVVGPAASEAELDDLVRRAMRSYARYWTEMFRLPVLSRDRVLANFRLVNEEVLAAEVTAGRGVVVALPHSGNWDLAGAWVVAKGWPLVTVAERLKPEGIYERFLAFRQQLGMEIIPLTGGSAPPLDILADRLGQGRVVPLLADRDLSARGVPVRFFDGTARMPAGPALLAIRTGAPLYAASMWYEPDGAYARLHGPLTVPEPDSAGLDERVRILTQRIADELAVGIARHPEDWHMLQRIWIDQVGIPPGATAPGPATTRPEADPSSASAGPT